MIISIAFISISSAFLVEATEYNLPKFSFIAGSSSEVFTPAVYSPKGVFGPANTPGAQDSHKIAVVNDRIYHFHGYEKPGSNVWSFNIGDKTWAWMAGRANNITAVYGTCGIGASLNTPGYRWYFAGDLHRARNEYVLYGGKAEGGAFGDLWTFNLASNEWTWRAGLDINIQTPYHGSFGVSTAQSTPGARVGSSGVVFEPTGEFIIFGGQTEVAFMADMFSFDFSTSNWAWISGSSSTEGPANYGLKNVWSNLFYPGRRSNSDFALNNDSQILYLFGGDGPFLYNDLWAFRRSSVEWALIGGDASKGTSSFYGVKGFPDLRNIPGPRRRLAMSYHRKSGLILMCCGMGSDSSNLSGRLGDFWTFDSRTNFWTWIAGSSFVNAWANYTHGFEEIPAQSSPAMAIDQVTGFTYISGGFGVIAPSLQGTHDQMWRLDISPNSASAKIEPASTGDFSSIIVFLELPKTVIIFGKVPRNYAFIFAAVLVTLLLIPVIIWICKRRKLKPVKYRSEAAPFLTRTLPLKQRDDILTSDNGTSYSGKTLSNTTVGIYMPGGLRYFANSYRLDNEIARGGSGIIWTATAFHPNLKTYGSKVVVKVPIADLKGDRELSLFYQEIALMNAFRNEPHIVKFLGYTEEPYSLILKFYHRRTLGKWLGTEKLTAELQFSFIKDISNGINLLHCNGVVHCDVKPDNVLIDKGIQGYFAVLTDFGIAQILTDKLLVVKEYHVQSINGNSSAYAAPEVIFEFRARISRKKSIQELAVRDIYAFGALICSVLSGHEIWS